MAGRIHPQPAQRTDGFELSSLDTVYRIAGYRLLVEGCLTWVLNGIRSCKTSEPITDSISIACPNNCSHAGLNDFGEGGQIRA